MNFFDRFLIAITPRSHAEALVDELYSPGTPATSPVPQYDVADLATPNVVVSAQRGVTTALKAVSGTAQKYLIIAAVALLVAVFIYAAAPAIIQRIFK